MKNIADYRVEIKTGQYQIATENDKKMVDAIFGDKSAYKFELYFHWFNLIHELGHVIIEFSSHQRVDPAEEELLVNEFAIAYWKHYGEKEKFQELEWIVTKGLERFGIPNDLKVEEDFITYAKEKWRTEEFWSFNSYGWFQFSCVDQAINKDICLESVLTKMGVQTSVYQVEEILKYDEPETMSECVVFDALTELRKWGVTLPEEINLVYSDDPNCHMCVFTEIN